MLTIWVEAWQQECCGEAFAVGDVVSWRLLPQPGSRDLTSLLGDAAASITHVEDHHAELPDGPVAVAVRPRSIRTVRCQRQPADAGGVAAPDPASVSVAWTHDVDTRAGHPPSTVDDRRVVGYLVDADPIPPR